MNQFENRQFNQLQPDQLALGDKLRETVANPFFGQIKVGTLASATVARAQLLRPFPQYDAVTSQNGSWGSSSYHALEMKTEKRYANGLNILVSYTWSKLMETGNSGFSGETLGSGGFQNWYNLAADKSVSISDQTHRFIVNAVYELPFFKSSKGIKRAVLGGWQASGIWSAFSGGPLGISSNVNNTFSQGGGQRPNWTGVSAKIDSPNSQRWFDTSQFSNPPNYTFGNAGRTFNDLRSDGTRQVDATISKNFKIRERLTLQFRSEYFNLTNTVRFAPPNTQMGNVQFGQVSVQGNQPRVIQFSLKLIG